MQIFQKTVLKEYIARQNQQEISLAFEKFKAHFGNLTIQENIKNSKEEQYQEGFLKDLFVNILGYKLYPENDYNLITEQKTETSAQKSDGAIIKNGNIIAVIELKSVKFLDLDRIEPQVFLYKSSHPNCPYIITSNFKKLRFYLENRLNYEEFDLFNLDFERFSVLYAVLNVKNLLRDEPIKLKKLSTEREQELTLSFYNDYQGFKEAIFLNIMKNHKKIDELLVFEKSQKLLDRIIFMSFAKDKGLLPANYIKLIVDEWQFYKQTGLKVGLYEHFIHHFNFINEGFVSEKYEIYAFNGGLFAPDEVLNQFKIDDNLLQNQALYISRYDFASDIDVNVLGNIFEHSLAELEKKKAELSQKAKDLAAGKAPKELPKRKEDGIFYTPIYITHYMIEETLGKMCEQKKTDLNWEKINLSAIQSYRKWLLEITVLDPACGSGAFLNQVLNFFIKEHQKLDELESTLSGQFIHSNLYHQILENNIFGVDINFESVSITKLSLWLRIAQDKKKLNDLSQNIKLGNSLIEDKNIDEKAFVWKKEFPSVKNGFDLIVGNPPYVDIKIIKNDFVKYYFKNYETAENRINLYAIFIERALNLLSTKGILSFIIPNSILLNSSYLKIRQKLYKGIEKIIKLPDNVFESANVETIIFKYHHNVEIDFAKALVFPHSKKIQKIEENDEVKFKTFDKKNWNGKFLSFNIYADNKIQSIIRKCFENTENLENYCDFSLGITPYDKYKGHTEDIIKNRKFHSKKQKDSTYKPCISGQNITRFVVSDEITEYIKYGDWLGAKREERFFTEPRIIVRQILSGKPPKIYAGFTDKPLYFTQIGFSIIAKNNNEINIKYILAILNSKLLNFIHKYKFTDIEKEIFSKILIESTRILPIKKISLSSQQIFIDKVNEILGLYPILQKLKKDFLDILQEHNKNKVYSKKLENWFELDWASFAKELEKAKITMSLKAKKEWKDFLEEEKSKVISMIDKIELLDKELDNLVYQLYELNEEEIKIIENG